MLMRQKYKQLGFAYNSDFMMTSFINKKKRNGSIRHLLRWPIEDTVPTFLYRAINFNLSRDKLFFFYRAINCFFIRDIEM